MNKNPFRQVHDGANRRLRGLWKRNGSYYVQTTVRDAASGVKKTTRLRLDGATTPAEAKEAAAVLRANIEATGTTHGNKCPTLGEYVATYAKHAKKAPKTLRNELHYLNLWKKYLGEKTRLDDISATNLMSYRHKALTRSPKPLAPRTINLQMMALKQLLLLAKAEGYLSKLPFDGIKPLRERQTEKKLFSHDDIYSMATAALRNHPKTGEQFADFIALLMYCGGRMTETMKLKWTSVDWTNRQLTFWGENTKNAESRRIDFNRNLESHLQCMFAKRTEDVYLFPSIRAEKETTSFKKILLAIRDETGLDDFTIHCLRHFFISQCVMSGIDFLSIAKWVGHKDGGILIDKTYGHLNAPHLKLQAAKLTF